MLMELRDIFETFIVRPTGRSQANLRQRSYQLHYNFLLLVSFKQ